MDTEGAKDTHRLSSCKLLGLRRSLHNKEWGDMTIQTREFTSSHDGGIGTKFALLLGTTEKPSRDKIHETIVLKVGVRQGSDKEGQPSPRAGRPCDAPDCGRGRGEAQGQVDLSRLCKPL